MPSRRRRGCRTDQKVSRGNRNGLERPAVEGESPVRATCWRRGRHLSMAGHEESCQKQRRPSRKAKHYRKTDSEPVP